MSEHEITLTMDFDGPSKASEIVEFIQKAEKYIKTNGDVALHFYLQELNRTHGIDFDSWWIPISAQLQGKQVTFKMIGSPSGTIEQDLVTWIKNEGGANIQGHITGDYVNEDIRAISNSEQEAIEDDIELREKLYGPTKSGNLEQLKELLDKIKDINAVEPWTGDTALMLASRYGHLEMVEYIIAKGADVNYVNEEENATALTYAAKSDHAEVVKTLVENGASIDYLDSKLKQAFGIS